MPDRIGRLGATIFRVPAVEELPALVSRIARLWAELHEADAALARELARKLPRTEIKREKIAPMGVEEFRRLGEMVYGDGWQSKLARARGMKDARTVRRWASGESPVPDDVAVSLREAARE